MLKLSQKKLQKTLIKFDELNLFSIDFDGTIYSRKIIHILLEKAKKKHAGYIGGKERARKWEEDRRHLLDETLSTCLEKGQANREDEPETECVLKKDEFKLEELPF